MKKNFIGKRAISLVIAIILMVMTVGCTDKTETPQVTPDIEASSEPTSGLPQTNVAPPTLEPQPSIDDPGEPIEYTVSGTISSNMVVQRNSYFNVFGWSENKGGIIYAEFMGETRYAVIDENGEWCVQFSSHEATTEPQALKIYPKNGEITEFKDILVGDVWVISGQSNAELTYQTVTNITPEYLKEVSDEDNIRLFAQSSVSARNMKDEAGTPQENTINKNWKWKRANRATIYAFSAIGYYFAKELSRTVDIPLGLVMAAAGGSTLQELMPESAAKECDYVWGPAVSQSGFYNTLIHPFTKNSITGMIFYQGESEAFSDHYKVYAQDLERTVEEYRNIWGLEFPFINIQLSTHLDDGLTQWYQISEIRAAQYNAYQNIENSYLVVSRDQGFQEGDPDWAHPYYKLELGKRAAAIAASVVYGQGDMNYSASPEPVKITWEKDHVLIDFKYVGDGLKLLTGDTLVGFKAYDKDGSASKCTAEIVDSDTVKISTDIEATVIGYGMTSDSSLEKANLGSSTGYPAPAFEISK